MKRPLGCLSGVGLIAALMALLVVGGVIAASGGALFSPGPLNAQAGDERLGDVASHAETRGNCAACHTPPWSSAGMADRCAACHTAMANPNSHLAQFHELLWRDVPEQPCRTCHPEHRGETAALTDISVTDFPHEATGFSLAAHRKTTSGNSFACVDCHTDNLTAFDVETCDNCHAQIDAAYMTAHRQDFGAQCLSCHDGVDRFSAFDHSQAEFTLIGAHTDARCGECHTAAALADFANAATECIGCHQKDDAHQGGLGTDCAGCHTPDDWQTATFDHAQTAFPLIGAHQQVKCEQCHAGGQFEGTATECIGCHQKDDAHEGGLGTDCAACHTPDDWQNATFDHAKSAFPLVGKHAEVKCEQCHVGGKFTGTPTECAACHQKDDAHQGQFGADCAGCHTPDDWKNATFDHAKTAFPLQGKHAEVKCDQCHAGGKFKGTSMECAACHQKDDAHQGQFRTDCAGCHTPDDWQNATFDHAQTAFPLTGAHQQVKCEQCHAGGKFEGTTTDCIGCHQDPAFHRGLFTQGCDACHTTAAWQPARFDLRHTFPINHGEGGASPCRTCHPDALAQYTCYGCHEHNPAEIQEEHAEEGIGDIANCVKCHPTGREEEGGED